MIICLHKEESIKKGRGDVLLQKVQGELLTLNCNRRIFFFRATLVVVINGMLRIKVSASLDFGKKHIP